MSGARLSFINLNATGMNTSDPRMDRFSIAEIKTRATDAKEVGVKNPVEETCCYPIQKCLQPINESAGEVVAQLALQVHLRID